MKNNARKMFLSFLVAGTLAGSAMAQELKDNPFLKSWDENAYRIPPFSQIKDSHYLPALKEGIRQQDAAINMIIRNRAEATFENTILPLEESNELIGKVSGVLFNIASAHATDSIRKIESEAMLLLEEQSNKVYMNPYLFRRIKRLMDFKSQLDPYQQRLLEKTYRQFVRSGAELDRKDQERLAEVNLRLSQLENKFLQNLVLATADYTLQVEDAARLEGLSADDMARAKARAEEKGLKGYAFGLDNPSIMPFLSQVADAQLRKEILDAYVNRCAAGSKYDNNEIVKELVALRLEKANLLGFEDFASYQLEERMAKEPEAVYELLNRIWEPALERAKQELSDMKKFRRKNEKYRGEFLPSDWRYYAALLLQDKYQWNDSEVKEYFSLDAVREGIFYLCQRLYGISFELLDKVEVPTPNTTAYVCKDKDGSVLGVLYLDMVTRPGFKAGGAWNTSYVEQSYKDGKRMTPVTSIVCNYAAPVDGKPTMLSLDEASTFFHEFGHALHALFADVKYSGLSDVPRDFVELPSQVMEHWATAPEMLRQYARHYKTGEVIPEDIIAKIQDMGKEGQGFANTELIAASLLDMDYHTLKEIPAGLDVEKFEKDFGRRTGLIPQIYPRYRTLYFMHTMGGGYSAGYYSYTWSAVLDSDAFEAFEESGDIFNREVAERFRNEVLKNGGMYDAMDMYVKFRGHEPQVDALLKARGLNR